MNERILKLASSCFPRDTDGNINATTEMIAEFAELIVEECIAQARSEEDRFYGLGEDDLALTMEHFQEVLKHHFGVEE